MHATVLSSSYAIVVSNIMEAGTKVKKNLIEYLLKEKAKHKGKWLTWDAVNEYRRRAQNLKKSSGEITKELRLLVLELMDEYGVTEIEAINIVNGYNTCRLCTKIYTNAKSWICFRFNRFIDMIQYLIGR